MISAVVVTYDEDPGEVLDAVDRLLGQARAPEEILIVDNDPGGRLAGKLGERPEVRVLSPGANGPG